MLSSLRPPRRSLLILSIGSALLLAACHEGSAAPAHAPGPTPVTVVTLKAAPVTLTRELPGRTSASLIAEVRPQVNGLIQRRLFTEGGVVKEGQALYQLDDATRFGLAYRSSVSHKLKGDTAWNFSGVSGDPTVDAALGAASHRANSSAEIDIKTPETVSASAFRQFDDKWSGMLDVTWSRTSRLDKLDIQFPGTTEGDEVIRQDWRNTYRVSLGADYRYGDALLFRGGIAFDQSPVRGAQLTHPSFPDSDRWWYSLGLNYRFDERASIDAAYSFVKFKNVTADYTNSCNPLNSSCTGNGETTFGQYKTDIQFVGISYNYRF